MRRRIFIKGGLSIALSSVLGSGVVLAGYPQDAVENDNVVGALTALYGSSHIIASDDIVIKAPKIVKDNKAVPIQVVSSIPNAESIALITESNPKPFVASFNIYGSEAFVETRIKLQQTGEILVVVKADGKLFANKRLIRVFTDDNYQV